MKIVIPAEEKSLESNVCESFGRTPYFLLYDTETKESLFIDNAAASSPGGAGIKAAQMIVDQRVNALLVTRLGENAAGLLKSADIQIYKISKALVRDNIEAYTAGELSLLSEFHAGFHGREEATK